MKGVFFKETEASNWKTEFTQLMNHVTQCATCRKSEI